MGTRHFRLEGHLRDGDLPALTRPLEAAGWARTEGDDWDLWWSHGTPVPPEAYERVVPGKRVNHIPGNGALTRKDRLARELGEGRLRCAGRAGTPSQPWHPRTFVMPDERDEFLRVARAEPHLRWVRKPAASARGEGVGLIADPVEAGRLGKPWLVQEYLTPHLIDGYKYTLRYYVVITSLVPLVVHVFDDGFTKFASRPFPAGSDDRSRFAHLTNPDVLSLDPQVATSARNLVRPDYLARLRANGHDTSYLSGRIDELIAATTATVRERLLASAAAATPHPSCCFELLGLDILIDNQLKPWLIECNLDPSLDVEADPQERAAREEAAVKSRLVSDLTALLGLTDPLPGTRSGFRRVVPDESLPAGWAMLTIPRPEDSELRGHDSQPRVLPTPGTSQWEVGDSLVLHSRHNGQLHVLNATAAHTWLGIKEGLSPAEIGQELVEATGVTSERVMADIWSVLAAWRESGLVIDPAGHASSERVAPPQASSWIDWNIGATYALAGVRVGLQAPDWRVMAAVEPALGMLKSPAVSVHHRLTISPSGSEYRLEVDGHESGPPCPLVAVGAECRRRLGAWALGEADSLVIEGASLALPGGGAVILVGQRSCVSRLLDAWTGSGSGVLADEIVVVRGRTVVPLYLDRQVPAATHIHRAGADGHQALTLLDESFVPVTYEAVPPSLRTPTAQPPRALLSISDDQSPDRPTPALEAMPPEETLLALLGARRAIGLQTQLAREAISLATSVPGFRLAIPGDMGKVIPLIVSLHSAATPW